MIKLEPLTISIAEAVEKTGLSRTSLYAAIGNGHLKVRKAGRRTLVETSALQKFITNLPHSND